MALSGVLGQNWGGVNSKLPLSGLPLGGWHDEYHPEAESAETRHIRMANGAHNPDAYRNISIPDHFGFAYDLLSDMGRRYGLLPRWNFLKSGNEQLRSDGRCWHSVGTLCDLFPVMAKEVA